MKRLNYILFLMVAVLLTACSTRKVDKEEVPELKKNQIYVFFVNQARTDVYPIPYTMKKSDDISIIVEDVINYMLNETKTAEHQGPIPTGITYLDNEYDDLQDTVKISFNVLYESVNAEDLLFFKTCVAWTILQLEKVDSISISLTDLANKDAETATSVESFDKDSFSLNFGDKSGYKQTGTIMLYFASADGESLRAYQQTVEISNTTSLPRLVVESLIAGPEEDGYMETLSDEVKIRNILVKDGICYVDLSDEFYDTSNPLRNDIIVYSVVNSLVELPNVTKVQFLKNGEKIQFFRETLPYDGIFERNLDLIKEEESD